LILNSSPSVAIKGNSLLNAVPRHHSIESKGKRLLRLSAALHPEVLKRLTYGEEIELEEIKKDLSFIAEPKANFVEGDTVIIATFKTSLLLGEIEEFFNMNERTFVIFEMIPSKFFANLQNNEFQKALFGNEFDIKNLKGEDNVDLSDYVPKISDNLKEFLNEIKEELRGEEFFNTQPRYEEPTVDEILDRINIVGLDNLSKKEKEILEKNSNNKK
jgi:hypothetical protein